MLYVGAIAILFISVIMMLNIRLVEVYNSLVTYLPLGIFFGFFFLIEIIYMWHLDFVYREKYLYYSADHEQSWIFDIYSLWNMHKIGIVLYKKYPFIVWVSGLILLLAMVGSLSLTLNQDLHSLHINNEYYMVKRLEKRILFWVSPVRLKKKEFKSY